MNSKIRLVNYLITSIFLIYPFTAYSQSPRMKDKFYLGYFNLPYESQFTGTDFLNDYKSLSLNAMQGYMTKGADTDPTNLQGGFNDSLSNYRSNVQTTIGKLNSTLNENSVLLVREKINRPAYGQRSTNEAEYSRAELVGNIKKPGYGYKHGGGSFYAGEWWQGEYVSGRYCQTGTHTPQYIVDSLYENLEQVNNVSDYHLYSDRKSMYADYRWYIKPRMRIPQSVANDPGNWDMKVVRIEVFNFEGIKILSDTLFVRNFLNSGSYSGQYMEYFNFLSSINYPLSVKATDLTSGAITDASGRTQNLFDSQVDYRVYWYGEVDVWLDYVRVDDEWAHFLFNPQLEIPTQPRKYFFYHKILEEVNAFSSGDSGLAYFYMDEYFFNNIPCISEVNRIIKSINPNTGLISVTCEDCTKGYWSGLRNLPEDEDLYNSLFDKNVNTDIMLVDKYPIYDSEPVPHNLTLPDSNLYPGTAHYKKASSAGYYNQTLNNSFVSRNIISQYRNVSEFTKDKNIVFSFAAQIHNFEHPFVNDPGLQYPTLREPTNEEISLQCYLALSYGAKHILHFAYNSERKINTQSGDSLFLWGMLQSNFYDPRFYNYYSQNKWDEMKKLDSSMMKIGKYVYNDNKLVHEDNRSVDSEGLPFKYIKDLISIYRDPQSPHDFSLINQDQLKYWELGFFIANPSIAPLDKSKYLIAVNKRCTPEDDASNGDLRYLKIKFDSSQLTGFRNWKIIEAKSSNLVRIFDKDSSVFINLGIYLPGEGKLYKIAPVMQEGGELIADENITASEFNCNSDVYSENKNVTINPGVTVSFADTVKWEFTGGIINIGTQSDDTPVFLKNMQGQSWKGISIINCSSVNIFRTTFSGLKNNSTALRLLDNYEYNVSNNTFNLTNLDSVSAIEVDYVMPSDSLQSAGCGENCEDYIYVNGFINENTINTTSSILPSIKCFAYGQYIVALMMNRNILNSTSGTIAVLLSNTSAGNIKNNKIYNYNTGICIYSPASYCDLYHNEMSGDSTAVKIFNSTINLGMQDYTYTGGFNLISSLKNNINTNEGYFSLADGLNTFNIDHLTNPHLEGTFDSENSLDEYAGDNCFKTFSGTGYSPRENVTCTGLNCDVTFLFNQICAIGQTEDYLVIDILGDGSILDTIWIEGGGSGGGGKNYELRIKNYELNEDKSKLSEFKLSGGVKASVQNPETGTMRELYNLICIEMRKRNFNAVHTKCIELLNNYPDSSEALDAVSKLYLSVLILDSSGNRLSSLKSYFETLILNNGSNVRLIRQLFYLVQKCKTALGEYQSAMSGFQQIIEQNPYNYLGLVASWDYAAASLMYNQQGGSGGIKNYELKITNDLSRLKAEKSVIFHETNNLFLQDDPNEKYDKSIFTKEDIKLIKENVIKSYENSREKETKRLKYLEEKVSEGKANESDKKELAEKRMLSEVVKVKEPEDIKQHLELVSSDLKKLFGAGRYNSSDKNEVSIIPKEYRLYQNYPNPFNPETKIEFELPEDTKVKLIIYDILGREVKKLLNNEYRISGRYSESFNGRNLASGVYFYTLRTEGFEQTKLMVLIK